MYILSRGGRGCARPFVTVERSSIWIDERREVRDGVPWEAMLRSACDDQCDHGSAVWVHYEGAGAGPELSLIHI